MNAYVDCVGCEQRQLDAQRVVDYLKANNINIVNTPEESDYNILITCAVDRTSEDVSVERMEDLASRMKLGSKLIIGGCLPSISPNRVTNHTQLTFSPRKMETLDQIFQGNVSMAEIPDPNKSIFDKKHTDANKKLSLREEYDQAKFGYKIVINQGCLLSCTFCKIKDATGKLKSMPLEGLVNQFKQAVEQKEPTIMIMGGDTGAYGYDISIRFYDLLDEMLAVKGEYKTFIHDFNINWLIRDLSEYERVFNKDNANNRLKAINFPIQSGSDRILKLMKRPYTSKESISSLKTIKRQNPHIAIGTHLIIGFPSETEQEFESTMTVLKEVNFDFVSCFPYSEHETAKSALLPNKIGNETINSRLDKIAKLLQSRVKIIR